MAHGVDEDSGAADEADADECEDVLPMRGAAPPWEADAASTTERTSSASSNDCPSRLYFGSTGRTAALEIRTSCDPTHR